MTRTNATSNLSSTTDRLLLGITLLATILYPLLYKGMYAGDAEIHLVYAENASQGHYFEFNLGEKSAGVTSPGYMLMLCLLFKILPSTLVPLTAKIINIGFWYLLIMTVFFLSNLLLQDRSWAYIVTTTSALLPGSAYNSTIGMENGIFGFAVALFVYLTLKYGWLESPQRLNKEILLGTLIGIATWLRPEAFVVYFLAISYRVSLAARRGLLFTMARHITGNLLAFVVPSTALVIFHYYFTGSLLPTSGKSRVIMGNLNSFDFGLFSSNAKFLIRLLIYFPLTAVYISGLLFIINDPKMRIPRNTLHGFLFCTLTFSTFFVLFSTVLGGAHLARYTIFIMPFMTIISGYAAKRLWQSWGRWSRKPPWSRLSSQGTKRAIFAFCAISLLAIFSYESFLRFNLGPHSELKRAMRAPTQRAEVSRNLYRELGSPRKKPIIIAAQEVQLRYWLESEFVIRSLDGRVDPLLLEHFHDGDFDHIAYIKARRIDYVTELVNYNSNPESWSLARLEVLSPGESLTRDGLRFERLESGIVRVHHLDGKNI